MKRLVGDDARRTRRLIELRRAKLHWCGELTYYLDEARFATRFVLHSVRNERRTGQRKTLRQLLVVVARHIVDDRIDAYLRLKQPENISVTADNHHI